MIRSLVDGQQPWPLFLFGPAGGGKTCAALCVLDFAGGRYYAVPELCEDMIRSQQGRLETEADGKCGGKVWPEAIWERIAMAPLVVLDELGCRDKVSEHHYEVVKRAIDLRAGKPFIAISNITDLTPIYDDRVASRLGAGVMFELNVEDRRLS